MLGKRLIEVFHRPIQLFHAANTYYSMSFPSQFYSRVEVVEPTPENEENNEEESNNDEQQDHRRHRRSFWHMNTAVMLLPVSYMAHEKQEQLAACFFKSKTEKLESNKLKNRVGLVQYTANKQIEDRYHCKQLENLDGYVVSVFDGHGGWQVAELATNHLSDDLDEIIKANKDKYTDADELITQSLKQAFDKVENRYLEIAREAYEIGFPNVARVGACALVAVVHNKKLYVANAGDCKAVLYSEEKNEPTITKLSQKFNANSKKEQARMKSQFEDTDIFVCRRTGSCYVKNILQPTRAFGDLELKHKEFNNPHNFGLDRGYSLQIQNYKGPYISHVPDVKVFDIKPEDKYLLLSSDGMWDELKKDQVSKIVRSNVSDKNSVVNSLLKEALNVVGKRTNMSESELAKVPLGHRRKIHDDMTIVAVDLQNQ